MSDQRHLEPGESFSGELIDIVNETDSTYGPYQVLRMRGIDGRARDIIVTTLLTELCSAVEHVRSRSGATRRESCSFCRCSVFDNKRCRNCGAFSNTDAAGPEARQVLVSLFCARIDQTKKGHKVRVIDWAVGTGGSNTWIWKVHPSKVSQ